MTGTSPFDHRPDAELGAVLREALSPADDAAFTARVVAAAEPLLGSAAAPDWWEVLVGWARTELAAASLALLAGAVLWWGVTRNGENGASALGDPLRAVTELAPVAALLAESLEPNMDEVLAVALGN